MELLRNCSHGSDVAVFLDSGENKVIKASLSAGGIENLRREVAGFRWYSGLRGQRGVSASIVLDTSQYIRIEVGFINGFKGDYRKGLLPNKKIVGALVGHYVDIWPYAPRGRTVLHGDLSVDNLILSGDDLFIIDWEHFRENATFWGFDALYLLFETLWFGMRERSAPGEKEVSLLAGFITQLDSRSYLEAEHKARPLKSVRDFILTNKPLWGDQLVRYPVKFPIVLFSESQVEVIDNMIASALNN